MTSAKRMAMPSSLDTEAVLDEIMLEQQTAGSDPETVVLCPRCSERMEIGASADSQDYPGIRICCGCADDEEKCGMLRAIPLDRWGFVQILKDGVKERARWE